MNVEVKFLGAIIGQGVENGKFNSLSIDAETFRKFPVLKCIGDNKPNR